MEWVCPICNGLASYLYKCTKCGRQMENKGAIEDFFDDYSTYLAMDITERIDGVPADKCTHLFYCNHCKNDKRVSISKFTI